jgi:uncharacterized membrane protein YtjA (UPF0391 family)
MLPPEARFSKAKKLGQGIHGCDSSAVDPLQEPVPWPEVMPASSGLPRRGGSLEEQGMTLLKWALIFFVVSIIAGVLGFTGISAASADVARFLFYVFVVIFLVLLVLGLTIFRV